MSRRVALAHRPNFLKARLLAPFSARYRARLTLAGEPEALLVVANHVVVTRDRRLALVKNSKAGCTSAAQLLYAYDTGAVFDGRIHRGEEQIAGPLHVRAGLDALSDASVYKFTFVRNPLARCVSAFQDFVLDRTNPGVRHHLPRLPAFGWRPDAPEADQFDAFLGYVEASFAADRIWTDPHFRLQTINIALGTVAYDHIGRLESYAEDMAHVLRASGAWREDLAALLTRRDNASRAKKFVPSPEQAARVRALYAEDCAAFGYE